MKKTDEQILNSLRQEFEKNAENAQVPLRLQKESIVNMLKNEQTKDENIQTDFSDKTGAKNKSIVILRRLTATAAMLAVVVAGALAMRTEEVKMTKVDTFYENNEGVNQIKNAKNDREVEAAIKEIINRSTAQTEAHPDVNQTEQTPVQPTQSSVSPSVPSVTAPQSSASGALDRYENLVAVRDNVSGNAGIYGTSHTFNNSTGVSSSLDYEADIVKKEGNFLYIVAFATNQETGGIIEQIKIVKAEPAAEMQVVSTIALSEYSSAQTVDECLEIHVKNGKLIALISRTDSAANSVSTVAAFYDISNPEKPVKIREHVQDGAYVSSSLQENNICLVTDKSVTAAAETDDVIPSFSVDGKEYTLDAQQEIFMVKDPDDSYIFITVTDISDFSRPVGRLAILGSGKKLYCSSSAVIFAREFVCVEANKSGVYESKTEICRFNIDGTLIVCAGSDMIDGSLAGGLSVDEESGNLRAVTAGAESTAIYVFGKNMERISGSSIAHEGEALIGSKFIGSNGYIIVSGENGERTMIIDLKNPEKPKAAGKIATEGFSDSLHMISDSLILSVKVESSEAVSLSLFDVSDPNNPKSSASYTLDKNHTMISPKDGRGVIVIADKNMFGIPVIVFDEETKTESSAYMVFDVSDGTFNNISYFSHSETVVGSAAARGEVINDVLYTVSGDKIVAFSIADGSVIASSEIM